jgi:hypothetical protein
MSNIWLIMKNNPEIGICSLKLPVLPVRENVPGYTIQAFHSSQWGLAWMCGQEKLPTKVIRTSERLGWN